MDNRYHNYDCPPLMNDGRFINNYVRSSTFDQYVKNINNIENATKYRHYLQNNGHEIMNNLKSYLRQNNTCNVEGKCLPISNPTTPIIPKSNLKEQWYEEMLDDETAQLDFMMHNNNQSDYLNNLNNQLNNLNNQSDHNNNQSDHNNNQPTYHNNNQPTYQQECTTCTRN
jgi:hypothetical protein